MSAVDPGISCLIATRTAKGGRVRKPKIRFVMIAGYVLLFASHLAGCASQTYKPFYSSEIITVSSKELNHYWKQETIASYSKAIGCFKVQMTIDSNGRIVNPTFIEKIGQSSPQSWLLDFLSAQRYTPASTNPNRVPVRTTGEWALLPGEMDTRLHAVELLNNAGDCFAALNKS